MGNFKRIDENITRGKNEWLYYITTTNSVVLENGEVWSDTDIKKWAINELDELSASMNFDNITNDMILFTK